MLILYFVYFYSNTFNADHRKLNRKISKQKNMSLAHVLVINSLTKLYQFNWTIGGACFYHVNWKFETFIFPDE